MRIRGGGHGGRPCPARSPRTLAVVALAAAGAGACAANSASSADTGDAVIPTAAEACRPPETNRLADDYSAAGLAGSWSLTMFADEGESEGAAATGRLELATYEPGEEPLVGGSPAVLHGSTDIDLASLGAVDAGDPSSTAAERPGVLVLQWGDPEAERPSVMLRLGDRSNRLDRMVFDGAYTALKLAEAADTTFAGSWESGAGRGPVAGGRFCAARR